MFIYQTQHNYEVSPYIDAVNHNSRVIAGNQELAELIQDQIKKGNTLFVYDCYPGVDKSSLLSLLKGIDHKLLIDTDAYKLSEEDLYTRFHKNITEDRVFGYMVNDRLENCFDQVKITEIKEEIEKNKNEVIFIAGVGASLFAKGDVHYYFDITRWEIQLRFRKGMTNWMFYNPEAPILTKYKIGFFVEWRLADTHKEEQFGQVDYWVDANVSEEPKAIDKEAFYKAFRKISGEPFRMEPYFDKSVWGGQWMKKVFGLDPEADNFGWSFDGVPEENSVRFLLGKHSVTFPTMNLVKLFP